MVKKLAKARLAKFIKLYTEILTLPELSKLLERHQAEAAMTLTKSYKYLRV
jgi:hypothetical protein